MDSEWRPPMIPQIEQFLSVLEAQLVLAICFYASVLDINCGHLSQILGQIVKMTLILKSRLESSLEVGFSGVNFLMPDFPKFFVKSPKQIGGFTVFLAFFEDIPNTVYSLLFWIYCPIYHAKVLSGGWPTGWVDFPII